MTVCKFTFDHWTEGFIDQPSRQKRWRFSKYWNQTHPDEQLGDDHVGHGAGQVQSGASVPVPVGLINLFLGAVCQQQHHQPQVVLHHRPKQLLPQRYV